MNHCIVDGMKKEARKCWIMIVLGYGLAILRPLAVYLSNPTGFAMGDAIKDTVFLLLYGSIGLYAWLYGMKYHVKITEDRVEFVTLFRKKELDMQEITEYSCKRYARSAFFGFRLYTQGKKVLVYTRYREAFVEILKLNGIAEKAEHTG